MSAKRAAHLHPRRALLGPVAAHGRATRLYLPGKVMAGQLPLLLLMLAYTYTGLTLLFAA
jgi:hypothetical protein